MPIETLDDVVEELLNMLGIYGAHSEACIEEKPCRCCAESRLKGRILDAVEVERKLDARPASEQPANVAQQRHAAGGIANE